LGKYWALSVLAAKIFYFLKYKIGKNPPAETGVIRCYGRQRLLISIFPVPADRCERTAAGFKCRNVCNGSPRSKDPPPIDYS